VSQAAFRRWNVQALPFLTFGSICSKKAFVIASACSADTPNSWFVFIFTTPEKTGVRAPGL